MRTATIHGVMPAEKSAIRALEVDSSDSTTVGLVPVISASTAAYCPRGVLVARDHESTGVGDVAAHLHQPRVRGGEDLGDPRPVGVERRAQRLRGRGAIQRFTQAGGNLVAHARTPVHLAGVRHEQHGPDDAVLERVPIAVGVVRDARHGAVVLRGVRDERDGVVVGPKRRARQRESPDRGLARLLHGVAPRQRVCCVVHLVEDHHRRAVLDAGAVRIGVDGEARVGDGEALEVRAQHALAGERRVERDADARGGECPLGLEVLRGRDDDDALDDAAGRSGRRRSSGRTSSCRRPAWRQ